MGISLVVMLKKGEKTSNKHFVVIDKRLFSVTKNVTAYRSKGHKGNNYDEKRGAVGFRGNRTNSQSGDKCQENNFVAIDCGASHGTKKQTDFRANRLNLLC